MLNFDGFQPANFINTGLFSFFGFLQIVLQVVLSTWAYRDARRRGNSKEFAVIVMVGVLVVPVAGAIVYFFIREDRNE